MGLDKEQINIWVEQIEKDLNSTDITPKDVLFAFDAMAKEQIYNRFDYATFWGLAENSPDKGRREYLKIIRECKARKVAN